MTQLTSHHRIELPNGIQAISGVGLQASEISSIEVGVGNQQASDQALDISGA